MNVSQLWLALELFPYYRCTIDGTIWGSVILRQPEIGQTLPPPNMEVLVLEENNHRFSGETHLRKTIQFSTPMIRQVLLYVKCCSKYMAQCNFFSDLKICPKKHPPKPRLPLTKAPVTPLKLLTFPVKPVASHQNVVFFSQARNILASGLFWSWAGARLGKSPMGWTVGLIFFCLFGRFFKGNQAVSLCHGKRQWRFMKFYFHPENWGRFPSWLIFFKWVETTN